MTRWKALFVLVVLCSSRLAAAAEPYTALWVFGGPLEDTGNYASVFGDLPAPFHQNRFSDGPLAIDILAEQLGLPLSPSLHRVGAVQGNNFSSVDAFASGPEPKDLHGQIDAYFAHTGNKADPSALYYMIIGGNEVIAATLEPDADKAIPTVVRAVEAKRRALRRLAAAGARRFLVPNFIDIGITPQIRAAGLQRRGRKMTDLHNRLMHRMLAQEQRRLRIEVIEHDWRRHVDELLASSPRFGFTNRVDSCLAALPSGDCDFSKYIFFNDLFPTARVHQFWGWELALAISRHPVSH